MSKTVSFEQSMQTLEGIVNHLERGDLVLDDALKEFEQGIRLARECQKLLNRAEKKIESLTSATSTSPDVSDE